MHAIADTERLVADGVITADQARTIEVRARQAMVYLAINSIPELKNKTTETGDDPHVEKAGKSLLQRILGDQSFSLADADLSSTKDMTSLLATAIEFEKDTVLFYELIRSFVQDPDVSDQLDTIIEEEKQHVQDLQRFMETSQTMGEKAIPKGAGNR